MDEEIRTVVEHGSIAAIAAAGGVDAPALPRGITGPQERDRLASCRRGTEMADAAFTGETSGNVVEAHAVKDILARWQIGQQQF
ncbi:hypothetical protein ABIG06_004506 [Bradyrhizobium sp. USDA 326]